MRGAVRVQARYASRELTRFGVVLPLTLRPPGRDVPTNLCLSIAAYYIQISGQWEPSCMTVRTSESLEGMSRTDLGRES